MEGRSTLSVGLLGGVLLFEWRGQHFFPAGNSLVQKVESHMDQISCQEQMAFLFKLISHFWSSLRPYFLFRTMNILQLCANSHRIPTLLLPLSIWHPQKCFANHLFHTKVSSPLLSFPRINWLSTGAEASPLLLPGAPPPAAPEACAVSLLQRPMPGSLSPPLQTKLQMKRKVICLKTDNIPDEHTHTHACFLTKFSKNWMCIEQFKKHLTPALKQCILCPQTHTLCR